MLQAMRHAVLAAKTLQFKRAKGCVFGCEEPSPAATNTPAAKRARTAAAARSSSSASAYDRSANDEATLRSLHEISHLDAFHLATQGGAAALGLGSTVGTFDVGKRFDAIVLDASATRCLRPYAGGVAEDAEDLLHKLLTLADDRNISAVFVGGRQVVGQMTE